MRADALRNRERILAVAREAFAQDGAGVTLDDIVRLSGLGVGTLYRHFPTREALIQAVYLTEMRRLLAAVEEFSRTLGPVEALHQWLLFFVEVMAAKRALKEALDAIVGQCPEVSAESTAMLTRAVESLCRRAEESGEIRMTVAPMDLVKALAGIAIATEGPEWKENARRMADVLVAGLRTGQP